MLTKERRATLYQACKDVLAFRRAATTGEDATAIWQRILKAGSLSLEPEETIALFDALDEAERKRDEARAALAGRLGQQIATLRAQGICSVMVGDGDDVDIRSARSRAAMDGMRAAVIDALTTIPPVEVERMGERDPAAYIGAECCDARVPVTNVRRARYDGALADRIEGRCPTCQRRIAYFAVVEDAELAPGMGADEDQVQANDDVGDEDAR